ncbi:MAG: hypothetical protein KAK00_00350 [Nanoarchaeota archaeon]|nr:hypothetical protein [Nanoarchaeota archaeon]
MNCKRCKRNYYDGSCEPNLCDECYDIVADEKEELKQMNVVKRGGLK